MHGKATFCWIWERQASHCLLQLVLLMILYSYVRMCWRVGVACQWLGNENVKISLGTYRIASVHSFTKIIDIIDIHNMYAPKDSQNYSPDAYLRHRTHYWTFRKRMSKKQLFEIKFCPLKALRNSIDDYINIVSSLESIFILFGHRKGHSIFAGINFNLPPSSHHKDRFPWNSFVTIYW